MRLKPRCYLLRQCDLPNGHPGPCAMTSITSRAERVQRPLTRRVDR